jgi:cyclopropane fatty-acyl-phospholipid synthase-like methyltransferase
MGHTWHHGLPEAEEAGASVLRAAQQLEEQLVAASGLTEDDWALDFGSGIGGPTVYMAKISGARFVGLSNNENLSARAREVAAENDVSDRAHFYTTGDDDYRTLGGFPSDSLDAVFFYESVCHLPDKASFFQAAHRVLKPGRRLVGIDWLQRPFGQYQTDEEIRDIMAPVNQFIRIPELGTVDSYRRTIEEAGFRVERADDLFQGTECWASTPDEDRPLWLNYDGPEPELFHEGKRALDAARGAGTFTIGRFVAVKGSGSAAV